VPQGSIGKGGLFVNLWRKNFLLACDAFFRPKTLFAELAVSRNLGPGWAALAVTSVLFAIVAVTSHLRQLPMTDQPFLPLPQYRLWLAALLPVVWFAGCLLCAGMAWALGRLLGLRQDLKSLLAAGMPALLAPLWPMQWPTTMAVSLGLLNDSLPGFPGLWTRELMPASSFIYMLCLLWLAWGEVFKLDWKGAFALAVISLVPTLGFWALVMR
jgi:hypothetical protein